MAETEALVSKNFLRVLVDPANPNIDIVAVHGLNPTNTESHAELTWTAGGKLWLRDFLPEQLPKARVLLFGYNSNVAFETSTAGVREQAENLLNRLKAKRKGAPDRPLLFVCHSLGGIVVKRALVHAKLDLTYDPIRRATYGVAFFGTPHRGGNLVRLGDIAAKIARGLLRNPPNTFLQALRADSLFADDLVQDFRQQLEDYYVLSIYETLPMGKLGVIVDQKSATLGLSGEREIQIAVDADHANVCKFPRIDGDVYEQVADNLVDLAERAVKAFADEQRMEALSTPAVPLLSEQNSRIFMVPHTSNPDFVGRERILETLRDQLGPGHESNRFHSQTRVALYGLGGVGKSQIAIEYAYWVRDQFPKTSVFWVHGSSTERCHQALSQIAVECKIAGVENPNADKLILLKAWLESSSGGRWLMIIDNADDSEVFFRDDKHDPSSSEWMSQRPLKTGLGSYIPECSHGSILITTRNKQAGIKLTRNRNLIEVTEMRQTEAIELIRKRIEGDSTNDSDLAVLVDELGNLPLTLVQAAAFIQENTLSIKTYLDILQSSDEARVNLLSQGFEDMGRDSEVPNAVTTTWMISFKRIKEQQPRAARLLSLMSFFNRQDIPKSLLSQDERDHLVLEKALGVLKAYSFITASVQDKSFNMHRLIHLVTRKWLEIEGEATQWAKRGLEAVQKSFPRAEYENWTQCAALLPHSHAVLDSAKDETITQAYLLHNTASYLFDLGQGTEAERLYSQAVKIKIMVKGLEHPGTLESMSDLALSYLHLGELDKAEQFQKKLLELHKRVLGSEHPDTLTSMNNLALTYSGLGELDKARQLEEEVLELHKSVLDSEHPDTLISMSNLAVTYSGLGELDKAKQLEEEVLELRKSVLGSEHPDTLTSMGNLGFTYSGLGELDKAEQLDKEVLELRKRVLGSEHPDTLTSMNNLAVTWAAQKRDQDAMDLMLECVRLSNKVLGSDHPDTIDRKKWLRIWQNKSSDRVEGESESSTHAEERDEVNRQDMSPDHMEGESEVFPQDKFQDHKEGEGGVDEP